jgi:hypothetical protein
MHARHALLVLASSLLLVLAAAPAFADQKIKTKSNIKNDRVASTCGQDCEQAGQKWARENGITDAEACNSASPAFTEGCKAYVKAQQAAPPAGASKD